MNEIDPKIVEYAKEMYGETCELVRRSEWSYSFKCGPKTFCSLSRFTAEKYFVVSADDIRRRWPSMDERERLDFASNLHHKETWTDNDTGPITAKRRAEDHENFRKRRGRKQ